MGILSPLCAGCCMATNRLDIWVDTHIRASTLPRWHLTFPVDRRRAPRQSLLGPLNLAFAAATTNLIADGATRPELTAAHSIMSRGILLGRQLMGLSTVLVTAMISFVYVSQLSFRGVTTADLLQGLALVGASLVTSAWAGVRGIVLRLLGWQARVTVARGVTAILTLSMFAVGYYWGGVDVSLITGFITLAVTAPLVLLVFTRNVRRGARPLEAPLGKTVNLRT